LYSWYAGDVAAEQSSWPVHFRNTLLRSSCWKRGIIREMMPRTTIGVWRERGTRVKRDFRTEVLLEVFES
jgi:hypothetical protein